MVVFFYRQKQPSLFVCLEKGESSSSPSFKFNVQWNFNWFAANIIKWRFSHTHICLRQEPNTCTHGNTYRLRGCNKIVDDDAAAVSAVLIMIGKIPQFTLEFSDQCNDILCTHACTAQYFIKTMTLLEFVPWLC